MPDDYRKGGSPDFDPTRRAKETLAWVILGLAVIIMGVFAFQVVLTPSSRKDESSKKEKESEQVNEKGKEEKIRTEEKEKKEKKEKKDSEEEPKQIGKIRVVVDGLNMRSSPEVRGDNHIASLPEGTELAVLSKKDSWYEVVNEDGVKGYVSSSSEYVEIISMRQ